jgi:DNA helicase-2/ATP-dependent DNA helicase PcrA
MTDLKILNEVQREAVEYIGTPQMIVAGAGSGKTRVLTYKIGYLLSKLKYKPDSILALTFTNKAANEMKDRIRELIGKKAEKLWMGTFHSIFARILRIESKYTKYKSNFSIYDTEDSLSLVNNIINNFDINIEGITAHSIRHRISFMKNHMVMPKEFRKNHVNSNSLIQNLQFFKSTKRNSTIYS